jgi:hypothetical protein
VVVPVAGKTIADVFEVGVRTGKAIGEISFLVNSYGKKKTPGKNRGSP